MNNPVKKLAAGLLAASMMLGLAGTASGQMLPMHRPSASGSYLAGSEALRDLHTAEAARYLMDATEVDWDNPMITARTFIALLADGQIEQGVAMARRLIEIDGEDELAHLALATAALKERRYASALTRLQPLNPEGFIGIAGTLLRAWAHIGRGDAGSANAVLRPLSDQGLDDFLVFHRALMADVVGDRAQALLQGRRALDLEPQNARAIEFNVRLLANAGRFADALGMLDTYVPSAAGQPILAELRRTIEAGQRPGKLAATPQAGAGEILQFMGLSLVGQGNDAFPLAMIQLARHLDPTAEFHAVAIAAVLEQGGRYEEANRMYEQVPASSPLRSHILVDMAENLGALGDRAEAMRRLNNFIVAQPSDVVALAALAGLQRQERDFEGAAATMTRVLEAVEEDDPNLGEYYFQRGSAYERAKQWDRAEPDLLRALELTEGHPVVLNYIGYTWVDMGINLDEGLDMVTEAVNRSPGDGYIMDSLGWALYRLERFEEAVAVLEEAVRLEPDEPTSADHLGDAYWQVGRRLEARFQWILARDLDNDGDVGRRASDKIENGLDPDAPPRIDG